VWKFDERKSDGSETDYSRRGRLCDLRVGGIALRAKTTVYNRRTEAIVRPVGTRGNDGNGGENGNQLR
jgi:hypothetical protein